MAEYSGFVDLSAYLTEAEAAAAYQALSVSVVSKTANYTITTSDSVVLCDASGGAFTITLPAASGLTGRRFDVKKTDSSALAVTIDGNASETIDGSTTIALTTQYESVTLLCDGSNWRII